MSIKRILKTKKCKKLFFKLQCIYDSRQQWKVKHKQSSILFIIILSLLSGCNKFKQHYYFALKHQKQLSKIIDLSNGIPSHDTMERTMHRIDSKQLNDMIFDLVVDKIKDNVVHVCIDGKFVRATREGVTTTDAIDILTIYIADMKLSLYSDRIRTNETNKNERSAIKQLLTLLHNKLPNKQFVITIDAIAATRPILSLIVSYGWDFIICIKSQSKEDGGFYGSIVDEFNVTKNLKYRQTTCNKNGRIELRRYYIISKLDNILDIENWKDVKSVGKVYSRVESKKTGVVTTNTRYFVFSKEYSTSEFERYQRSHWSIETFHYVLDYSFNEDRMRMKKDSSTLNTNLLRKFVTNIINCASPSKSNNLVTAFRDSHRLSSPTDLLYCILKTL